MHDESKEYRQYFIDLERCWDGVADMEASSEKSPCSDAGTKKRSKREPLMAIDSHAWRYMDLSTALIP